MWYLQFALFLKQPGCLFDTVCLAGLTAVVPISMQEGNLYVMQVRQAVSKLRQILDKKCHPGILEDKLSYVSIKHPVHGRYVIAPKVDGRIVCVQT